MNNINLTKLNKESVLLSFSVEPRHDHETLARYLREYPEHAATLVELSLELWLDEMRPDATEDADEATADNLADKAWQQFQNIMGAKTSESNPFVNFDAVALKTVAKQLDVNNLFLARLRDRVIEAKTIPDRFVQALATALNASSEALATYLHNPPTIASGHSFKSNEKPEVGSQMSFDAAIAASQLLPEQQDKLRKMME